MKHPAYSLARFFYYLGLLTIGQTLIRPVLLTTLSDFFFLAAFILTVGECLIRKKMGAPLPKLLIVGLFIFIIGGLLSSSASEEPLQSLWVLTKFIYLLWGWFWLSTIILQRKEDIYTAIFFWVTSVSITGMSALLQFFWNDIIPNSYPVWGRMRGLTNHINDLGGISGIALVPAMMLVTQRSKKFWRIVLGGAQAFFVATGLILSVSLTALAATISSLLVWIMATKKSFRYIIILILCISLAAIALKVQNDYSGVHFADRLTDISSDGIHYETVRTRMKIYAIAWKSILQNPWIGVGLEGPSETERMPLVHNFLLRFWFQGGLFGVLGMLLITGMIALVGINIIRKYPEQKIIASALLSSYIAFLVFGLAQPVCFNRYGWVSAALILALHASINRQIKN